MNKPIDKEPAEMPASIPSMSEIEQDRKREIGAQARAAVENVLTKGGSVSAAQLRRWGPDGVGYFFQALRTRITKEIYKITDAAAPPHTSPKSAKVSKDRPQTRANERRKITKPPPRALPVSTEKDWVARQYDRRSVRARAIMHGLIIAAVLFIGAAVISRFWAALVPLILQQIQTGLRPWSPFLS